MMDASTLEDLRVLDLSEGAGGAYCARLFADHGADVIAVEPPGGSPLRARAAAWESLARNKRSITLDVSTPTGRRLFRKMAEGANVVIETFPPGRMESLGLAFADLQGIKRRIILTSVYADQALELEAHLFAGLNAFAATAIAAHNADAYEVPQHIVVDAAECLGAVATLGPAAPGERPFTISTLPLGDEPAPPAGEHNGEFYCDELGLEPAGLVRLRAAGVI